MRCTFGSVGSVALMHESYVCGYLSILQALSCPSLNKWLRCRQRVVQAFMKACLKWLLCSSNVCICLPGVMGVGWRGGGDSKIWQIAENCLQTVIPVWTHSAHLVVIWQQKCRGGGLSSESGATYYPSPPPFPLHFFWFGLQTYWGAPHPSLWGARSWRCLLWCLAVVPPRHSWVPLWL